MTSVPRWSTALLLAFGAACLALTTVDAQPPTTPRAASTGRPTTILSTGGLLLAAQAAGDLPCATGASGWQRLADVATGQVLISGGVGACPSYSANPTVSSIITPIVKPAADSTTAVSIANAAGTGKFVFDTSNGRMAGGKATAPTQTLDLLEAQNAASLGLVTNTTSDTAAAAGWRAIAGTNSLSLYANSQGYSTSGRFVTAHGLIDTPYLDLSSSGSNPIDFWTNGSKVFSIANGGKVGLINAIATAGLGVPAIYSESISTTQTANFTAATYTPPATAGRYRVAAVITTTSATNTGTVQVTVDYVDSQGTVHTADIIPLVDAAGALATTKTGASKEFYTIDKRLSINNAGTAIVLKVVITGAVSYTVSPMIEQGG